MSWVFSSRRILTFDAGAADQLDASQAAEALLRAYADSCLGLQLPPGSLEQPLARTAQLQTLSGGVAECTESCLPLQADAALLQLPRSQVRPHL